jgi:hypothetical protein
MKRLFKDNIKENIKVGDLFILIYTGFEGLSDIKNPLYKRVYEITDFNDKGINVELVKESYYYEDLKSINTKTVYKYESFDYSDMYLFYHIGPKEDYPEYYV